MFDIKEHMETIILATYRTKFTTKHPIIIHTNNDSHCEMMKLRKQWKINY